MNTGYLNPERNTELDKSTEVTLNLPGLGMVRALYARIEGVILVGLGSAATLLAAAVLSLNGVDASLLPALFVAGASAVMLALALDNARPLWLLAASVQLPLVVLAFYGAAVGVSGFGLAYLIHALALLLASLDRKPFSDTVTRLWLGAELTVLATLLLSL